MIEVLLWAASLLLAVVSSSPLPIETGRAQQDINATHANHIFNAIHDSMRQFGSSLHHNGMSYFVATVPAGTHFYHGAGSNEVIEGVEWVAFEPEHALAFARFRGPPPSGKRPGKGRPRPPPPSTTEQRVFESEKVELSRESEEEMGYLHTYSAKQDLRLIYIDGQSAAKTSKGTLDSQDYVLVNSSNGTNGDMMGEKERADQMCQRARKQWKGQIDGILRMEEGFEIILCSFKDSLSQLRLATVENHGESKRLRMEQMISYYQAVSARYEGIGGNRVRIDYDDFVSAFTFADVDLFQSGKLPRLNDTDTKVREEIKAQLDRIASKSRSTSSENLHDWQSIADMIVARHSPRLAYITSPAVSSYSTLHRQLEQFMRPFIDYSARNYKREVNSCTEEYIPAHWPSNVAGRAIRSVSHRICSTMLDLLNDEEKDLAASMIKVEELKAWLDWTNWKQCSGCKVDEVCIVPMWPQGAISDWDQPSCANKTTVGDHFGYWGFPHPRPPRQ